MVQSCTSHHTRSWIASPDAVNPNYTTEMNNTSLHVLTRPSKQLLLLGVLACLLITYEEMMHDHNMRYNNRIKVEKVRPEQSFC